MGRVSVFFLRAYYEIKLFLETKVLSCAPQNLDNTNDTSDPLKLFVLVASAMLLRHWAAQFQAMQVEGEPQYMAGVGTEVQAAPQAGW